MCLFWAVVRGSIGSFICSLCVVGLASTCTAASLFNVYLTFGNWMLALCFCVGLISSCMRDGIFLICSESVSSVFVLSGLGTFGFSSNSEECETSFKSYNYCWMSWLLRNGLSSVLVFIKFCVRV